MSDPIKLIQGDTYTPIIFEIRDEGSADEWEDMTPLDLRDIEKVTLKFKSLAEDRIIAEINCDILQDGEPDGPQENVGQVQVTEWVREDGSNILACDPGVYSGELETKRIERGRVQTIYNTIKFKVRPEF